MLSHFFVWASRRALSSKLLFSILPKNSFFLLPSSLTLYYTTTREKCFEKSTAIPGSGSTVHPSNKVIFTLELGIIFLKFMCSVQWYTTSKWRRLIMLMMRLTEKEHEHEQSRRARVGGMLEERESEKIDKFLRDENLLKCDISVDGKSLSLPFSLPRSTRHWQSTRLSIGLMMKQQQTAHTTHHHETMRWWRRRWGGKLCGKHKTRKYS